MHRYGKKQVDTRVLIVKIKTCYYEQLTNCLLFKHYGT